jgi:EmrB/QacA subfamily drug resistance transporter
VSDAGLATMGKPNRRVLGALCAVLFLTFLDLTIVSVALANIQAGLHASITSLQWVVNGYALVFASLMLPAGALADRFGRKRLLVAGVGVFCAGSVMGALAPNVAVLIAARAIMGVGAAASEPGTLSIIRQIYPEARSRARALGAWAAVSGLALALGPVIGGVLVGIGGWRAVFWFNLGAGLLIFAAAVRIVPESADPKPVRLDLAGYALVVVGLGALIFAVIQGESAGYGAGWIVVLFAASAVAAVAFVVVELRTEEPMLDVRYLRLPAFSGSLIVAFAVSFSIFAIFFFVALYLQVVVGEGGFRTAVQFAPMAVAMVLGSSLTGRWVARVGARTPMVVGCLAGGAGVLLTDVALSGHMSFVGLSAAMAIAGLGFGVTIVPVTSVTLGAVPPERSGMAASVTNTSRELGAVVGVAALGSLVNGHLTTDLTHRLAQLGVPPAFRGIVIDAIETGKVPSGPGGLAAAKAAYGPIVERVIAAAFGAFHSGLDMALLVSGIAMIVSGIVAWATLAPSDRLGTAVALTEPAA